MPWRRRIYLRNSDIYTQIFCVLRNLLALKSKIMNIQTRYGIELYVIFYLIYLLNNHKHQYIETIESTDTNLGICCSPKDEVFQYDSQQSSHRSDLQYHMPQSCNLHTHSPIKWKILNNEFSNTKFHQRLAQSVQKREII